MQSNKFLEDNIKKITEYLTKQSVDISTDNTNQIIFRGHLAEFEVTVNTQDGLVCVKTSKKDDKLLKVNNYNNNKKFGINATDCSSDIIQFINEGLVFKLTDDIAGLLDKRILEKIKNTDEIKHLINKDGEATPQIDEAKSKKDEFTKAFEKQFPSLINLGFNALYPKNDLEQDKNDSSIYICNFKARLILKVTHENSKLKFTLMCDHTEKKNLRLDLAAKETLGEWVMDDSTTDAFKQIEKIANDRCNLYEENFTAIKSFLESKNFKSTEREFNDCIDAKCFKNKDDTTFINITDQILVKYSDTRIDGMPIIKEKVLENSALDKLNLFRNTHDDLQNEMTKFLQIDNLYQDAIEKKLCSTKYDNKSCKFDTPLWSLMSHCIQNGFSQSISTNMECLELKNPVDGSVLKINLHKLGKEYIYCFKIEDSKGDKLSKSHSIWSTLNNRAQYYKKTFLGYNFLLQNEDEFKNYKRSFEIKSRDCGVSENFEIRARNTSVVLFTIALIELSICVIQHLILQTQLSSGIAIAGACFSGLLILASAAAWKLQSHDNNTSK